MGAKTSWSHKLYQVCHRQGVICLHCGSFTVNESLFCQACEEMLWRRHPQPIHFHESSSNISGTCLFRWYPDQDRLVSKLLLAMKGGMSSGTIKYYTSRFCAHLCSQRDFKDTILVPCPSLREWDHAEALAEAFHEILGIPLGHPLQKEGVLSQKDQSRLLRERISMKVIGKIPRRHVIFIDDIVTTGATAAAARRALAFKHSFEVWCMGHRQLAPQLFSGS